jgi:hypothetical protein
VYTSSRNRPALPILLGLLCWLLWFLLPYVQVSSFLAEKFHAGVFWASLFLGTWALISALTAKSEAFSRIVGYLIFLFASVFIALGWHLLANPTTPRIELLMFFAIPALLVTLGLLAILLRGISLAWLRVMYFLAAAYFLLLPLAYYFNALHAPQPAVTNQLSPMP